MGDGSRQIFIDGFISAEGANGTTNRLAVTYMAVGTNQNIQDFVPMDIGELYIYAYVLTLKEIESLEL